MSGKTNAKTASKSARTLKKISKKTAAKGGKSSRATPTNAQQMQKLLKWWLPDDASFAELKPHGNTSWVWRTLVSLALCWAWSESKPVTDAFTQAVGWCQVLESGSVLSTYQGFMGAAVKWTDSLLPILWKVTQLRMEQLGEIYWRIGGWVLIAFDGSRSTAPRTILNEKAFCAPHYGKSQKAKARKNKKKGKKCQKRRPAKKKPQPQVPQVWITLMWHMRLRLPWLWRLGPSNASERAHVTEMLDEHTFPKNTLFCGDAGFIGYPLWSRILDHGHQFIIRVGANVRLLSQSANYELQEDGTVLCWPQKSVRLNHVPLRLRLIKIKRGKEHMWLLTSVLNAAQLTVDQAAQFYEMRWGIEVEFRGLKQTLDRAHLRCRHPERLLVELHWSILAMTVAELFALKEQLPPARSKPAANTPDPDTPFPDPRKRSLAQTIRAIRHALHHLHDTPPPTQDLFVRLRQAVTDNDQRHSSKRAHYHPPNPDKKPLGDPQIRPLTPAEQTKLQAQNPAKAAA